MNEVYTDLERGFYKQAEEMGVEKEFLDGYFKVAKDISDEWQVKIAQVEKQTGDPFYRVKLAEELYSVLNLRKVAFPDLAPMGDTMKQLGGQLGGLFHQGADSLGGMMTDNKANAGGVGGAALGGGGGLMIGFMLHKLLGIPLPLALLLGGLGGGALGGLFGAGKIGAPGKPTAPEISRPGSSEQTNPDPRANAQVKMPALAMTPAPPMAPVPPGTVAAPPTPDGGQPAPNPVATNPPAAPPVSPQANPGVASSTEPQKFDISPNSASQVSRNAPPPMQPNGDFKALGKIGVK